jgi:hypothetical protein
MSLLDFGSDTANAAAPNFIPPPKPKTSAWADVGSALTAVPRGVGEAAAQVMGTAADLASAARTFRDTPDMKAKGLPVEAYSSDFGDALRDRGREFRPDPTTASTAEQILYGFSRGASKIVAGAIAGGIPGVLAAGAEEGFTVADELRREGVDVATRAKAGLVQGAGLALAALPAAGQTLKGTLGLYALGGPGGFMAQQALTREILQSAGYDKLGMGFDPLDPVGLAVASLIPAGFAAYGFRRAKMDAAVRDLPDLPPRAPDAQPVSPADTLPPSDLSPIAQAVKRYPQEVEDAARVLYQADVRESANPGAGMEAANKHADALARAEDQMARGEPVQVADVAPQVAFPSMDFALVRSRFAQTWASDSETLMRRYTELPDTRGGKVVNTDEARALSDDYNASNDSRSLYAAAVHETSSAIAKEQYRRLLAAPPQTGKVLILGGGGGSGKTSSLELVRPGYEGNFDAIMDTTLSSRDTAVKTIDDALASGREVEISYTARDPMESIERGIIPRAASKGRTVPLDVATKAHRDAPAVLADLALRYIDDPRVSFSFVDNTGGPKQARKVTAAEMPRFDYNQLEQRAIAAAERAYEEGRINEAAFEGLAGFAPRSPAQAGQAVPEGQARSLAARANRQPEQGGGQAPGSLTGPAGSEISAITERGLSVALRYRLAEVGELTTSHTDDLTANSAFPAELQPRDRARAASAEQISRIENGLRPELLGESAKASDGAPIVGPDAVVESGNARTIALRRAYTSDKADPYRAWLADNAERFGLTREQVEGMSKPVLVRERVGNVDRAEFARQANESTVAAMSPTEQAMSDARRIDDLGGLVSNDDGTINLNQSGAFIRRFVQQAVSPTERGAMLQANGQLSQSGMQRVRNAVFAKAYGDGDLVSMLTESTDANVRNILAGMMRAAPDVAKLADLAAAGAREGADIAGPLVSAVRLFSQLRSEGRTVQQFLAQDSMFGDGVAPEVASMLEAVSANARAPKRIAEMIGDMVDTVNALGDKRQISMFGDAPTGADAVAGAAEKAALDARLAMVREEFPDMMVQMDGMAAPMRMDDFLAAAKAEADEMAADAPLMKAAAECALTFGV